MSARGLFPTENPYAKATNAMASAADTFGRMSKAESSTTTSTTDGGGGKGIMGGIMAGVGGAAGAGALGASMTGGAGLAGPWGLALGAGVMMAGYFLS